MIIGLCLYGSSATALLKLKFNDKSSSSQKSIPLNTLSSLPRMNLFGNLANVPAAVNDYLHTIDLSPYQKMLEGSIANNPKLSIACAAACVLIVAACAVKKSISAERWQQIVDLLNKWADVFIDKCYDIMPVWMQTTSTFTKTMCLQPLASFTQSYIEYNTIHALLSIVSLMIGGVTGYSKSGVAIATTFALVGANQLGFNRLEAKMDANQAETNKNFETVRLDIVAVRNDIANLGTNVTDQIKGVNVNVDTRAQEISEKINGLDKRLISLSEENQDSAKQIKKQIDELKKSFTEILESKIELLSKELQQKIKESDTTRDQCANYLNNQVENITKKLTEFEALINLLNSNSSAQNQNIENLAKQVTQDISQFTSDVNKKIDNLSGDVTGIKNQLNGMQEISVGINDAMQKQAIKLEDLELKLNNVSAEVQENIKEILKDINKFNQVAKEDAALATEKLVQRIDELSEKNKKIAEKLNQELLVKIEEFIKETRVEGEALKKAVKDSIESARDDLQIKVDDIQKQQNECVNILNVLLDGTKNQDSKVSKLVDLVNSNQKEIGALGITARVQIETINERLDKIQDEIIVNKQEVLGKINKVVQETSTIKKLLNIIDEKEDAKYQLMSTVLEKTSDLSGQVSIVHNLIANVKAGRDEDSEFIKKLDTSLKAFDKEFYGLNDSINNVYHKIEQFEEQQNLQKKQLDDLSKKHDEEKDKRDREFAKMQEDYKKLEELIKQGNEDLKGQIASVGRQGGQAVLELRETIVEGFAAQQKIQRERNPQRLTNARRINPLNLQKLITDNPENGF